MQPDDQLLVVLKKAQKLAKGSYELSAEPEVRDRLSYLSGLLETTVELMSPIEEPEPSKRKLMDYLKG